jgi:hypothetical protein
MEYVIPIVLVVVLVGGFVTFLVLNATSKSSAAATGDDEGAPGIGRDPTPLGDTSEHAGHNTDGEARAKPQPVTSEAGQSVAEEGRGRFEREPSEPASERLADRDA